ncbi:MAG: hypothetical protein JXB17_00370 [Bacteroidales bacterium]|nr:hypothetical protein [Bacteroidales bacterium]
MIKEIVQFVDVLPQEAFTKNLTLNEGLYLFLDIQKQKDKYCLTNVDENGCVLPEDKLVVDKNTEPSPIYNEFLFRFENSKMINPNKSFNSSAKIFIAIGTPFGISVSKQAIEENLTEQLKKNRKKINEALLSYYKKAKEYINPEEIQYLNWFKKLSSFSIEGLKIHELYSLTEKHTSNPLNEILYFLISQSEYKKLGKKSQITIFLKEPTIKNYKDIHQKYLADKVFNKNEYNIPTLKKGEIPSPNTFGISDAFNVFQEGKLFLQHKTGINAFNKRVLLSDALKLWRFSQLRINRQIPNPLPIFVDKEELPINKEVIRLYNDEHILSYSEIIKSLHEHNEKQLQNFYLIFFNYEFKGSNSKINDFDFIPVFKFNFPSTIVNVFNLKDYNKNILPNYSTKNIFEFEDLLNRNIFFVIQTKTNYRYGFLKGHYFDKKPEPSKGYELNSTARYLLLKYGKTIYDYIYKSREQSFSSSIFDEIISESILYDIRHDDKFIHDRFIKEKLNIWFSLYNYFQNSNQLKRENMVNKTAELIEKLKQVAQNEQMHIGSDDEFAFGAGQLIWKILSQSKSANRSHSLLEPFLQKVDSALFKQAIAKAFDTYKHEFVFYTKKYEFDKIMSEVMGYEPNEKNMKNQLPLILAGYFAETIFKAEQSK